MARLIRRKRSRFSGFNNRAYERMKAQLFKLYYGKHIAIANGKLVLVADSLDELGAGLRGLHIAKALTVHVGHEESGKWGEWLWGSIAKETA